MPKKYLVFMWTEHEAQGGWEDLKGRTDTLAECDEIIKSEWAKDRYLEDFQIVDVKTQTMIDSGRMEDTDRLNK